MSGRRRGGPTRSAIAKELEGQCENLRAGGEVHRHTHLIGKNRAKMAQVYPKELVRGLREELRARKQISGLEEKLTGEAR